jgi:hypothetical protein
MSELLFKHFVDAISTECKGDILNALDKFRNKAYVGDEPNEAAHIYELAISMLRRDEPEEEIIK